MPLSARAGLVARDGLAPRRLGGLVGLMGGLKLWVRAVPKLPSLDSSILTSFCCMTCGPVPSSFCSIPALRVGVEIAPLDRLALFGGPDGRFRDGLGEFASEAGESMLL